MLPKWSRSPLGDFFSSRPPETISLLSSTPAALRISALMVCWLGLVFFSMRIWMVGRYYVLLTLGVVCVAVVDVCFFFWTILVLSKCIITFVLRLLGSVWALCAVPQAAILNITSKMCCLRISKLWFVLLLIDGAANYGQSSCCLVKLYYGCTSLLNFCLNDGSV